MSDRGKCVCPGEGDTRSPGLLKPAFAIQNDHVEPISHHKQATELEPLPSKAEDIKSIKNSIYNKDV